MKHLKEYNDIPKIKIPKWGTAIDITKLELIDPFNLSYFEDVENGVYFYEHGTGMRSYSYDDKWSWTVLFKDVEPGYEDTCGYVIFKNDEPIYVVGIYEPRGVVPSKSNVASQVGGLITILGHQAIINLWLDYGEYDSSRIDV